LYRVVSSRYFEAMSIPVLQGRAFGAVDGPDQQQVAIVSQSMANRFWPRENPVGRRVRAGDDAEAPWLTIVGVTGDTIDDWFDRRNAPALYVPMTQRPSLTVTLVAHTSGDTATIVPGVRAALRAVDSNQPPTSLRTLSQALHDRTIGLQMIG